MLWIKIFLSLLLLIYLGWSLDLAAIWLRLQATNWIWVTASMLCLLIGQLLSAIRWAWLAQGLGLVVNISKKVQLYFLGMFLSLFLPSIIGGDVARGYLLARGRKQAGWQAAASVLLERLNGLLGLGLLVSFCMFFLDLPGSWLWLWNVALLCGILLIIFIKSWWLKWVNLAWLQRWPGLKLLPITSAKLNKAWWQSLPLSLLFQILVVQAHVFLGMAVGLSLSWFSYGFMVCLMALASALPISFNGFGIRESGYIAFAVWFGAAADAAAAMAALWVLVLLIVALPGAYTLWKLGGTTILASHHKI